LVACDKMEAAADKRLETWVGRESLAEQGSVVADSTEATRDEESNSLRVDCLLDTLLRRLTCRLALISKACCTVYY
jgi:hypothetical protein